MKNETRRRIANWLLKIPGFIEAVDISEDINIAKTMAVMMKDMPDQHVKTPLNLPSFLNGKSVVDWSREEAAVCINRISALRDATVTFKNSGDNTVPAEIVITLQHPEQTKV